MHSKWSLQAVLIFYFALHCITNLAINDDNDLEADSLVFGNKSKRGEILLKIL